MPPILSAAVPDKYLAEKKHLSNSSSDRAPILNEFT
jgi:hypothetical protein